MNLWLLSRTDFKWFIFIRKCLNKYELANDFKIEKYCEYPALAQNGLKWFTFIYTHTQIYHSKYLSNIKRTNFSTQVKHFDFLLKIIFFLFLYNFFGLLLYLT
jgi:hypothetical protein